MAGSSNKRRRDDNHAANSNKKNKTNNHWKKSAYQPSVIIEPGWQGIFATCERGRESRVVGEFSPILEECASKLYPELNKNDEDREEDEEEDIESAIMKELSDAKDKKRSGPITSVKLDIECVTFFRLKPPLVPTDMVRALCESARQPGTGLIRSKFVHRLTPITRTGKATLEGLKEVAKAVLEPYFHSGQTGIKFAIRPTTRNHNMLNRNEVINTIASCVGPAHKVDLKEYELLILVELYKNVCGMSVVKDFEKFKRFNFGQLQTDASQVGADDTLKLNEQKQEKKEKQEKQETQETQETQEVEADIRGIEKADTIKTQDSEKEVTTT